MTSKLPKNLNIVKYRPERSDEKVMASLGEAPWLNDPQAWNRAAFIQQVEQAMIESHGATVQIDRLLVTMLASQVEVYVQCWAAIRTDGLVSTFNAGTTPGKNLHVGIADRALRQVATLLSELSLSPRNRTARLTTGRYAQLLRGPNLGNSS
jgi:phage terminase small subunit